MQVWELRGAMEFPLRRGGGEYVMVLPAVLALLAMASHAALSSRLQRLLSLGQRDELRA